MDQLVDQINMLEEQMPPHPKPTWVHTLLFALNLIMQETILKQQDLFDTRNKLQKLAVELKTLETKKTKCMRRGRINNVLFDKNKTRRQTHNHWVEKAKQHYAMQNGGQTPNI